MNDSHIDIPARQTLNALTEFESTDSSKRASRPTSAKAVADSLYGVLTDEERFCLSNALMRCVEDLLAGDRAVYLDELGVLFPDTASVTCSYLVQDKVALRKETITSLNFEKCDDFASLPRERFPNAAIGREIAAKLYTMLPLAMQLHRPLEDIKQALRGLLRTIRSEVVTSGISERLGKLGTFYALHNRHGTSAEDWFAGADIFFSSTKRWVREAGAAAMYDRPILQNATELFDAAFGAEQSSILVDVVHELEFLKIDPTVIAELPNELRSLSVKVFRSEHANSSRGSTLLYSTDGLRTLELAAARRNAPRCELTFQLGLDSESSESGIVPRWPARAFALAAVVLAGQLRGRNLAVAESIKPITETARAGFQGVLLQRCALFSHEQLFEKGEFSFVNIVALTSDELQLAKHQGLGQLVALLKRKGLDQVTKARRRSVIARSVVGPGSLQPRVISRSLPESNSNQIQ